MCNSVAEARRAKQIERIVVIFIEDENNAASAMPENGVAAFQN
jgi:hypothetical protein